MRVVVDTNVWISGRLVPTSPPGLVLQAVRDRLLTAIVSFDLADEIVEVFARPRFATKGLRAEDLYDILFFLAPSVPLLDLDLTLRDPRDAPVIAAAVAGRADAIVTGDRDLLDDADLRAWLADRGIEVLKPAECVERLGLR